MKKFRVVFSYKELPNAKEHKNEIWDVEKETKILGMFIKRKGFYISDGKKWIKVGL